LPASALRTAVLVAAVAAVDVEVSEEVVEVEVEPPSATNVTRPDILPASALRTTAGQFATTVTARVTLPGSVLRVTVPVTAVAAVALTAIVEVSNIQEARPVGTEEAATAVIEEETGNTVVVDEGVAAVTTAVDLNAINATGSVTLPGSAVRRRTVATSATAPGTSPGTATRRRTPATTVTRLGIS